MSDDGHFRWKVLAACVLLRTVRDIACEMARERWRLFIATIEDFDIVTATAAVDLVVAAERVSTQSVGATFQVHLCEMNIYGLVFRGSNAHTTVEVVSTAIIATHSRWETVQS